VRVCSVRSTTDAHDTVHSDCMIDNLRLVSNDMRLLRARWHQLLNICDYVGNTVGEAAPPAVRGHSPYTFLGIRFGAAATPSERIIEKLRRFGTLLTARRVSAIDLSAGFGVCIFATQALRQSMAHVYYILKFMRRVSHGSQTLPWSRMVLVWPSVADEWTRWIVQFCSQSYTPKQLPQLTVTMYTDASETGWGVGLIFGDRVWSRGGPWSHAESARHINVLELEAIRIGLRLAAEIIGPCTINALVKQMEQEAAVLGIALASLDYIESARNLADKPSRATQLRRPRSTTPQ
jgi:hypothetical protein